MFEERIGVGRRVTLKPLEHAAKDAFERPANAVRGIVADEFRRPPIDGHDADIVIDNNRG